MDHAADNIRILAASMVEKAKSGHPGGAMGGADFINVLYAEYLQYDPQNPTWEGRDRFFLDPGHMAPMLYSQLALIGKFSIDELKQLVVKKPIYLMYGITLTKNPMYYHIPCQYVAFTANNKLELIADGLDTNNDKLSRYKIVLTFVLASEATVEDTEIAITVDNYLHLPELPEDADTKTYQLKAVNGTLTWVE